MPLSRFSLAEQVDAFHNAFRNYFLPIHLTEESLEQKLRNDRIDLDQSVAAVEDGRLCGFIFQGFGEWDGQKAAYNAGTGVIPEARGKGLTRKMYQYLLPALKDAGVKTMVLEAIEGNHSAIHIYKSLGYHVSRTLTSWRMIMPPRQTAKIALEISLEEGLSSLNAENWETMSPSWQFMNEAILINQDKLRRLEARHNDQLIGYCYYLPGNTRILQMAVDPGFRRKGVAGAMMDYLFRYEAKPHIVNVEEVEGMDLFFEKYGFQPFIKQVEMIAHI